MDNSTKLYFLIKELIPLSIKKKILSLLYFLYSWKWFTEFIQIKKYHTKGFSIRIKPILRDKFLNAACLDPHYFNQDLFIAQEIHQRNFKKVVDFGSRIDGFIAHVASFRPIELFDIRPLDLNHQNITFKQCDVLKVDDTLYEYTDCLTSLHVVEHIGLGRYGDSLDPEGHKKAIQNFYKILKGNGSLFISVPIGKHQRIEFNAHRVFSLSYLLDLFQKYNLISFSYIDDKGILYKHVKLLEEDINTTFNLNYGCGIFHLKKPLG